MAKGQISYEQTRVESARMAAASTKWLLSVRSRGRTESAAETVHVETEMTSTDL